MASFPLKTQGRVSEGCAIADLEGDGKLDLVAVDEGGYFYAWDLAQGSIYKQPWPMEYGNNWNTANSGYKSGGNVGHLYEDWASERNKPFKWLETDTNNSLTEVSSSVFSRDNGTLKTNSSNKRNYTFTGPNMSGLKNYTVKGKIKFDDANAEFGINVYSQWPNDHKMYSIIKKNNKRFSLYYVHGSSYSILGEDTAALDTFSQTGTWYNYRVRTATASNNTIIRARFWKDSENEPSTWPIAAADTHLTCGTTGMHTYAGSGYRYWSDLKVLDNDSFAGAYMAYEDFRGDSIVDVKPYTPRNWSHAKNAMFQSSNIDTMGFVLAKTNGAHLEYRNKPELGADNFPAICLIKPQSNMEWKNYEYSGSIIKPAGSMYDSIEVYLPFYYSSFSNTYKLKFMLNGVYLTGGRFNDSLVNTKFDSGDSVWFDIIVQSKIKDGIEDSIVNISAYAKWNGGSLTELIKDTKDTTSNRIKSGYAGIEIEVSDIKYQDKAFSIRCRDLVIKKKQN